MVAAFFVFASLMAYDVKALQEQARKRFPESDFVHKPGVAIWKEHKTEARKVNLPGGEVKEVPERTFDKEALELIAERCNERIADTGDFAALSFGHTDGVASKEVAGFVGPYYVAPFGNVKPRWAIYADEWHFKDDAPRLRKMPRRSVELLTLGPDMGDWYFDPIAALGADTPRLDLGMVSPYSRDPQGHEVLRYSAVMPSGSNVFVPSTDAVGDKKETYGMEDRDEALVAKVLAAIAEMPAMKWAAEQSAKAEADVELNEADSATSEDMPNEAVPPPEEAPVTDDGAGKDALPPGGDAPEVEPERERETYEAEDAPAPVAEEEEPVVPSNAERAPVVEEYRMIRRYSKRLDDLEQFVERIARNEKDRHRESALDRLASHKHIPAETLEALKDKCLYSRDSDMSDKTFAKELSTLESLAVRSPSSIRLPHGVLSTGPVKVEEPAFWEEVTKYAMREQVPFDTAKAAISEKYAKPAK